MNAALLKSRAQELVSRIRRFSSPAFKKQMQTRFGINTEFALGTPVTVLRKLVKGIPTPDPDLADALWATSIHEARILAALLADPAQMTREKLDRWVQVLNSWDICDACALHVFSKTKHPL